MDTPDTTNGPAATGKKRVADEMDDGSELGMQNLERKVWLVKVPKFVAEKWNEMEGEGEELGRVRIYNTTTKGIGGKVEPKITLHIPDAPWSQDIPRNYNLRFTNTTPKNEFVFTEDKDGQAVEIAGRVHHEATIGPIIDDDYRRIMQQRTMKAAQPARTVKVLDDKRGKSGLFIAPSSTGREAGFNLVSSRKKNQLDKKERLPHDELLNLIFQAFEKYEHWNFKGLVEFTQQPQAWLKEVLNE
ncbi:hypothetical protein HK102_010198, partial [Quaeritorhiza haematococci]